METEGQVDIKKIFSSLSDETKQVLISMGHASHHVGFVFPAIKASSGLEEEIVLQALSTLKSNNLVQQGKIENGQFVPDDKGARYRLPKEIRRSLLKDIVKLDDQEIEQLLKDWKK